MEKSDKKTLSLLIVVLSSFYNLLDSEEGKAEFVNILNAMLQKHEQRKEEQKKVTQYSV